MFARVICIALAMMITSGTVGCGGGAADDTVVERTPEEEAAAREKYLKEQAEMAEQAKQKAMKKGPR